MSDTTRDLSSRPATDARCVADNQLWSFEELQAFITEVAGTESARPANGLSPSYSSPNLVESTRRLVEAAIGNEGASGVHDNVAAREIHRAGYARPPHRRRRARDLRITGEGRGMRAGHRSEVARLGVQVRAGLHAGEIELRGET